MIGIGTDCFPDCLESVCIGLALSAISDSDSISTDLVGKNLTDAMRYVPVIRNVTPTLITVPQTGRSCGC